jgi:hypothetical protein
VAETVLVSYFLGVLSLPMVFAAIFFQTFLKQVFESAREFHSKSIGGGESHVSLQSQLMGAFYSAQFLGPIASVCLLWIFRIEIPLVLDATSFLIAGALALQIKGTVKSETETHVLNPIKYLFKLPELRGIFFLRVSFWIPLSIFNYLLFSIVTENFGLGIEHSAWIYSALGLGATLAVSAIRNPVSGFLTRFGQIQEGSMAFLGQLTLALMLVVFSVSRSLPTAIFGLIVFGVGMGMNAVATQALRRKFTTQSQFTEVVGLELVVSKFTDVAIATIAAYFVTTHLASKEGLLISAALVLVVSALMHLKFVKDKMSEVRSPVQNNL